MMTRIIKLELFCINCTQFIIIDKIINCKKMYFVPQVKDYLRHRRINWQDQFPLIYTNKLIIDWGKSWWGGFVPTIIIDPPPKKKLKNRIEGKLSLNSPDFGIDWSQCHGFFNKISFFNINKTDYQAVWHWN